MQDLSQVAASGSEFREKLSRETKMTREKEKTARRRKKEEEKT